MFDDPTLADRIRKHNDSNNRKMRSARTDMNDVGEIPECLNPQRKEDCKLNLKLFAETYHSNKFDLRWSNDHIQLMSTLEEAILRGGGCHAFAFPRGSGKTTIALVAAEWALLYKHKRFVVLIAANGPSSKHLFKSIKTDFESNPLLFEDFPEVCYPLTLIADNPVKARFQHQNGRPTKVVLSSESMTFAELESSTISGSVIRCISISAHIRGMQHTIGITGETIRPDMVLIDDPQTDNVARSKNAVQKRADIIDGTIMGLAGPRKPIAAVMPCTVIQQGDLAERFLDRSQKPEWKGKRTKLLDSFPDNMELWREYQQIRIESFQRGGYGQEATQFYIDHREEMDRGAVAGWDERFNPPLEISAIQHAMNLYFRNPVTFAAEYQNDPLPLNNSNGVDGATRLVASELLARGCGLKPGIVPNGTQFLTAGVDVQKRALYYVTVAWGEDFGGAIVDFGTFPKQRAYYFTAQTCDITLSDVYPGLAIPPLVNRGLQQLNSEVFSQGFKRDGSTGEGTREDILFVQKILIDANWSVAGPGVYSFCNEMKSTSAERYLPSHGKGVTASMIPFDQWAAKPRQRTGKHAGGAFWRILPDNGTHVLYETNYWKSRIAERLKADRGSSNALLLPGNGQYQMLADHLACEYPIRTMGRGREVDEWKADAAVIENHYWDCVVQAAVGASILGLAFADKTVAAGASNIATVVPPKERKKLDPNRVKLLRESL